MKTKSQKESLCGSEKKRKLIEEAKAVVAAGWRRCPRCDEPVDLEDTDCGECGLEDVDLGG